MLQEAEEMVLSNMAYCFIYRCKVGLFQRNMKELLYIVKKYFFYLNNFKKIRVTAKKTNIQDLLQVQQVTLSC